jgi:hypothetical protein
MTSSLDREVLEYLTRYLVGEVSTADFHRWFMPRMRELAQAQPGSHPLSRRVALRLAEFTSDGGGTESELREVLLELFPSPPTVSTLRSRVAWTVPPSLTWFRVSPTASDLIPV